MRLPLLDPNKFPRVFKSVLDKLTGLGWRRVAFSAACLTLVVAGVIYCSTGQRPTDRGFTEALPPVLVLFGVLGLVSPFLISRTALAPLTGDTANGIPDGVWRRFLLAAVLFTIAAGTLWAQRLDASLWWDEVTSMRENIVGRWKHRDDSEGHLIRPSWPDTMLEYHTPNNHSLYSGVARVTHELMGGVNDSDFSRPYFSELALRLPAFIAGLLAIPLVGFIALRIGSLAGACLAMGWMLLHPWIMEFSTSARGYSFAMLFLLVAVMAAVRIFRDGGGWRCWILFGLGQILAFMSIPTVAHMLVALNIAVLCGLLFDRSVCAGSRWSHVRAFFATNLFALGFALAYFLPKLTALDLYLNSGLFSAKVSWSWMRDCVSNFLFGQPYEMWERDNPYASATEEWPPFMFEIGVLFAATITISALVVSYRRGVFSIALALAILLPPLTVFLQGWMTDFYMLPWYSVWALPLWLALLSAGSTCLIELLPVAVRRLRWFPATSIVVMLGLVFAATQARRAAYLSISFEQMRESAELVRESPNPFAPGHEKVITTSLVSANHAYDPWNRRLRSTDDLWEQVAEAEAGDLPLFCTTAWIQLVEKNQPEIYALLMNPEYFEPIGPPLYGLHIHHTRHTFRYKPGTLSARLAQLLNNER